MPADLVAFLLWMGLLDKPVKAPAGGTWYKNEEVPF
jgi:hypothetical protein